MDAALKNTSDIVECSNCTFRRDKSEKMLQKGDCILLLLAGCIDVAEEQKRSRQAPHFWAAQRPQKARAPWVRRLNPYRWFEAKPKAIAVDQLPSNLILPMQKSLVQDYALPFRDRRAGVQVRHSPLAPSRALTVFRMFRTAEADLAVRSTSRRSRSTSSRISSLARSLTTSLLLPCGATGETRLPRTMPLMKRRRGICTSLCFHC